jgi:hypothetical protein
MYLTNAVNAAVVDLAAVRIARGTGIGVVSTAVFGGQGAALFAAVSLGLLQSQKSFASVLFRQKLLKGKKKEGECIGNALLGQKRDLNDFQATLVRRNDAIHVQIRVGIRAKLKLLDTLLTRR